MKRREFLRGGMAISTICATGLSAHAEGLDELRLGLRRFGEGVGKVGRAVGHGVSEALDELTIPSRIDPTYRPQTVRAPVRFPKGTVVVEPHHRYLYLMHGNGRARRYNVGVGKRGSEWWGTATVGRKEEWPSWRPTRAMLRSNPKHYAKFANGIPGGEDNPLGARALYLYQDGRDTLYRIHGTNDPHSIGTNSSSGCIRMFNEHVIDLYERVPMGADVVVLEPCRQLLC